MRIYADIIKRIADLFVAAILFIIVSPLLIAITIILFIANEGRPFFLQQRPGKNGKTFLLLKFKTMNDKRDSSGNLLPDAEG